MRITKNPDGHEGTRRERGLWRALCLAGSLALSTVVLGAQTPLPPGAVSVVSEVRFGSLVALCADTGGPEIQRGARRVRATGVWVGRQSNLQRVRAGLGACDPAWSPDGRRLAVTSAEGLWVIPATATEGLLRVESRLPLGEPMEFTYRAFSKPSWSPDGALVGLLVTNGGTSWVEVFEVSSGRLLYTSPPEHETFSWGGGRELKLGSTEVRLPTRR